jgi:hypothetical protein
LKEAGVAQTLIAELVGHSIGGETMGRYGKRFSSRTLYEAVSKADFGLDLTHIASATRRTCACPLSAQRIFAFQR